MSKNKKKLNKALIRTGILFIIFIIYTILVSVVDVKPIGPEGTSVGFAGLNDMFRNALPYNDVFYNIAKYGGLLAFVVVGFYGVVGLVQLIKGKSLKAVDFDIYAMGGTYVLTGIVYALFEVLIINYRPVILEEGLEASYPSSHTILAIAVLGSALVNMAYRLKHDSELKLYISIGLWVILAVIVIARTLSGVHWISDIIGGVIIGASLVSAYDCLFRLLKNRRGN